MRYTELVVLRPEHGVKLLNIKEAYDISQDSQTSMNLLYQNLYCQASSDPTPQMTIMTCSNVTVLVFPKLL